jgi:Zn finger protein HypA/HybF involved in hydrogenase expression
MGHTVRGCKQERIPIEKVEIKCVNCDHPGHRARDCTEKRKDKFACRNCGYVKAVNPSTQLQSF